MHDNDAYAITAPKKLKIQLYNSFTPAALEDPNSLQNPLTKQNKSHMMPISMEINTLPAAGAALHWKHWSIRKMKRPNESMLALCAQTVEWMNVAQRDEEQVAKRWREKVRERGQKGGRESAWIPLCLTARVLILHAGRTPGVHGASRESVGCGRREGRYEKRRGCEESDEDQWEGTNSAIVCGKVIERFNKVEWGRQQSLWWESREFQRLWWQNTRVTEKHRR